MPILGSLLVSLFAGLAGFFARWFSKKVALGVTAVTVFAGLTVALYVAVGALLAGVVAVVPSDSWLLMGLWIAFPDNTQALISAGIAADAAVALYRWNVENLRLMAYIT